MKKVFLFLAAAAMLFAGCKKEDAVSNVTKTEFTVSFQPRQIAKRALGENTNPQFVDEVVLIVWDYANNKEYTRIVNTGSQLHVEADGTITTTFTPSLHLGGYYQYLFWADNAGYYDLTDPSNIVAVEGKTDANDILRDAFCTMWKDENVYTEPIKKDFTLKRPFAQLNLIATDLTSAVRMTEFSGDMKFTVTYKGYKGGINLLEGVDLKSTELVDVKDTVTAFYDTDDNQAIVIMDYLWMPVSEEKYLTDISFSSLLPNQFSRDFTNIPFQRNYKTNLIGELFHASSVFTVTVDPIWDGSDTIKFTTAKDIQAANEAFANGATRVQILDMGDETTLYLPQTAEEVFIDFAAPTAQVTVKYGPAPVPAPGRKLAAGEKPAVVNITTDAVSMFDISALTDSKISWYVNSQAALDEVMNVASANTVINFLKKGEYVLNKSLKEGMIINGKNNATLYFAATYTIGVENVVLNDLTIKGSASNTTTSGTITVTKNASFNNCTMIDASSKMIVVGGTGTVNFNNCNWNTLGKGRGIMVWGGAPVINIDGCTFDCTYPFNVDAGTPNFTVTNSTLNGWTSYGTTATVSFENCEFGKSTSGYAYCKPYSSTTFTKCEFSEDYLLNFGADGIVLTLTNCTQAGQAVTDAILDLDGGKAGTLVIDGATVYPLAD